MIIKELTKYIVVILMILIPIVPDYQIARPKLFVLEIGFFICLFFFVLYLLFSDEIQIRSTGLYLPFFAVIIVYVISYFLSRDKSLSEVEMKRILLCVCLFFIFSNLFTDIKSRKLLLGGWLIGAFLAIIYGILQRFGGLEILRWHFEVPQMRRVMSTFGNPIFFASYLTISLPLIAGFFFITKTKILRFLSIIIGLAGLYALYLTETRAAWLAVFIATLSFLFLSLKSKKLKIILTFILLIFACLFGYLKRDVLKRPQAHLLIWRDTIKMWLKNPITGTSIGTFHIYFPDYASKDLRKIWPQKQWIINDAHNEYLQILSETGILGFGVFLWLFITLFTVIFNISKNTKGIDRKFINCALAGMIGIMLQNVFSVDMRFIISGAYFFMLAGTTVSFSTDVYNKKIKLASLYKKIIFLFLIFIFGICSFSYEKKSGKIQVHLVNVIHMKLPDFSILTGPSANYLGLLPFILKPYLAHKKLEETPDFFDEKILEPLKTIEELQALLKKYPTQASIYEKIAWIYAKEKNFPMAIEYFNQAIKYNPDLPGPYNNLGNIYFLMNNRQAAIEYYKKSIAIQPSQVDARLNLGISYYYEGRLKEAAEQFNEVLRIQPNNEKAIVYLKKMRE